MAAPDTLNADEDRIWEIQAGVDWVDDAFGEIERDGRLRRLVRRVAAFLHRETRRLTRP